MKTIFQSIVPAQKLGIQMNDWTDGRVELVAPLASNRNDKGTAFAGSIASMLSLAGWAAITLALREAGIKAEVMIVKSEIDYRAAAHGALFAEATLAPEETERMTRELNERGRCRILLAAQLHSDGIDCAHMSGSYAIMT
jgi:thioesterase domain-containing protein